MKNQNIQKPWLKRFGGAALVGALMLGISGCDDDVRVRSASYGSSYYQPYDYYYYPDSYVYFNISTRDYYYYDRDRWIRNRVLPRHYHLKDRDRVKIRIKSKDKPYLRHHEHRSKYGPRRDYKRDDRRKDRDYRRDYRTKNSDRNRTNIKSHDYHYYPSSSVYYNPSSGHYYYPERNKWKQVRKLPTRYRLDQRDRVKVKVKSKDRPYVKYNEHRTKYATRTKYRGDTRRDRVERTYNEKNYKDYQWNRK